MLRVPTLLDAAWSRIAVGCAVVVIILLSTQFFETTVNNGTAARNVVAQLDRSWSSLKQIAGLGSATVDFVAVPYPGEIPATALASFPRSGSSFTRSLVERATGWY